MSVWQHFDVPELGYASAMSEAIIRASERCPELLWPVDQGLQLIVSDYSGQHRQATHEAYSFLLTTWNALEDWVPQREEFRLRWLPDGRRLSFKQLREPMRRRAFPHFLSLAGQLRANLVTFLIDRRIETFVEGGPEALASALDDCFPQGTPPGSVEKMYRVALFVAMLQAGLRKETQESVWISDHDETLDSFDKREGFARLATYLTFGLTHWRNAADQTFTTTERRELPEWVEDIAAIPDIAAGACACLSGYVPTFLGRPTWVVGTSSQRVPDWRARDFGHWLSSPGGVIRHVLVRLAPNAAGEVQASAQTFLRFGLGQTPGRSASS